MAYSTSAFIYWPKLCHIATASCKRGWTTFFCAITRKINQFLCTHTIVSMLPLIIIIFMLPFWRNTFFSCYLRKSIFEYTFIDSLLVEKYCFLTWLTFCLGIDAKVEPQNFGGVVSMTFSSWYCSYNPDAFWIVNLYYWVIFFPP